MGYMICVIEGIWKIWEPQAAACGRGGAAQRPPCGGLSGALLGLSRMGWGQYLGCIDCWLVLIHIYTCVLGYMYVCMYVSMYVCIQRCIGLCTYLYTSICIYL